MDLEHSHSPLLPGESRRLSPAKKGILISIVLVVCVATISLSAVKTTKPPHRLPVSHPAHDEFAPPLTKFKNPVVIMISLGGFGFDYKSNQNYKFPNIASLIDGGTEADKGLIPVFPTQKTPNLYSIATGLYPENHGIASDEFPDPGNVSENKYFWFKPQSKDPKWWLGEPMWVTVARYNLKAMTYFWPGSEVRKYPWDCPPENCRKSEDAKDVTFEKMVHDVLKYFDSCNNDVDDEDEFCDDDIPVLFNLYFDQPDQAGLEFGPDSDEVGRAIATVDDAIGLLVDGLRIRGVFEEVNIILLSDQGMVSRNDENCTISLQNIMENSQIKQLPEDWVPIDTFAPLLGIQTPMGTPIEMIEEAVIVLNHAADKPEVTNGDKLVVYAKQHLPDSLHYSLGHGAARIPAIVGLVNVGYVVRATPVRKNATGGIHGYENSYPEMRGIFVGHGPRFRMGYKVPSFENIDIYNLVMEILEIQGAANQGSLTLKDSVLLPLASEMAPAPAPAAPAPKPSSGA